MTEEPRQTDGVIDTRRWTGLAEEAPSDPVHPRKILVVALLGAATSFMIIAALNSVGIASQTAPGTLFGTDHVPARWVGRHWSEEHWNLRLFLNGEDAIMTLRRPPPDWAMPGQRVMITYGHGRLFHDVLVQELRPAAGGHPGLSR